MHVNSARCRRSDISTFLFGVRSLRLCCGAYDAESCGIFADDDEHGNHENDNGENIHGDG